uniref:NADH-ubiquinone oxidoreductase chain 4 n=1 Tax=Limnichidae sp. MJTNT-2012 TaxID=1131603 RepID=H6W8K1_9COLE|nr:NADH dehydrogenase subunit 4 [Limnichidae sp. MJTNT-2012]
MMKFIFMMVFMIPLSFINKSFWLCQVYFLFMFFLFMLNFSFDYMISNLSMFFGTDLLSYIMVLLSFWICSLMVLASEKIYKTSLHSGIFMFMMVMLNMFLYMTFSSMDLFIFYLFFESSLIPTLMLILGWGYQPERIQAGMYLLFYTMFASLPMLISIFYILNRFGSLEFFFLVFKFSFFSLFNYKFCFLVKMPMYFVHLWLPKAHVEAPVSGSMILAGIMLKLGGYGMMRMMVIFSGLANSMNYIFVVISMLGGLMVSLICMRQGDIKSLIAYSSVAHMGMVLGGIMTMNYWGFCGSLMMMVAHGLCSSGLFCLANISYERLSSRSLFLSKGMISLMPSMSLWWFLLSSSNMAAPPSLNLLGEIILLNSLIGWSFISMFSLIFLSFFSAAYSLYLYSYSQHGKIYLGLFSFSFGYSREYLLMFMHWVPLNLLFLKSEYFMLWI